MRIISLGYKFEVDNVINCRFNSSYSLLNCDLLYIDPSTILNEYYADTLNRTYMGYKNLDDDDSISIVNDMQRRRNEISDLLKLGKTVFITITQPLPFYRATGEKKYSGTGRNRATTRMVTQDDIMNFFPVKIKTVEATGSDIDFRGEELYRPLWDNSGENLYFKAYIDTVVGKPFLYVKGTTKVVGTCVPFEKGNIVFIPTLLDQSHFKTKKDFKLLQEDYINTFQDISLSLKTDIGDTELPLWTHDYYIRGEKTEKDKLHALEIEISELQQKIEKQNQVIEAIQKYKLLLTESGQILEKLVNKLLSEIGFMVTEGIPGRDDLILQYDEKIAVVEVKGVTKSAAEKHAAQLEKWVNEYYTTKSIQPKGILIVNPYRDLPLIERTEDFFPSQMIGYSQRRGHCLISTLQLLCLYFDIQEHPEKRDDVINKLFMTEGIYEEYQNWREYIEY